MLIYEKLCYDMKHKFDHKKHCHKFSYFQNLSFHSILYFKQHYSATVYHKFVSLGYLVLTLQFSQLIDRSSV